MANTSPTTGTPASAAKPNGTTVTSSSPRKKVIIAGSRNLVEPAVVDQAMEMVLTSDETLEIAIVVCGGAFGIDILGALWADSRNIPVRLFPAHWECQGKAAGHIRNKRMGDYADVLIAIWDGKSPGTKHMIDYMSKLGKRVIVVKCIDNEVIAATA